MTNSFVARRAVSAVALLVGTSFVAAACSSGSSPEPTAGGDRDATDEQSSAIVLKPLAVGASLDVAENAGGNATTDDLGLTNWQVTTVKTLQTNPVTFDAGWSLLRVKGRAGSTVLLDIYVYLNPRGLEDRPDRQRAFGQNMVFYVDPATVGGVDLEFDQTQNNELIASLSLTLKNAIANRDAAAAAGLAPDPEFAVLADAVEGAIGANQGAPRVKETLCDEPFWQNALEATSCTASVGSLACALAVVPGIGVGAVYTCAVGALGLAGCGLSVYNSYRSWRTCDCKINGNPKWGPGGADPQEDFCSCEQESGNSGGTPDDKNFGRGVLAETTSGILQCSECPTNTKLKLGSTSTAADDTCVCGNNADPISTEGNPAVDPNTGAQGDWTSTCDTPHVPMCRTMQEGDSYFPRWEYCCDGDGTSHEFPAGELTIPFNCPVGQHYRVHSGNNYGTPYTGCYTGTCQGFGLDPAVVPAIE